MPLDVVPPKYIAIINTLRSRIEAGTYPPDTMLPSEATLTREFGVARPTLVRALEYLRQHGWIESRQGLGRFILGVPTTDRRHRPGHGLALLDAPETTHVRILTAGPVSAPRRAAAQLGIVAGTPIVVRRRLVRSEDDGLPLELSTVVVPAELAEGTRLGDREPISEGLLRHLSPAAADRAEQRISARLPSASEARLLAVNPHDCVLVLVLTLLSRTGQRLVAVESLLPARRRSLDDSFSMH
jgi:GntR family transcriptional regulator